MDYAEIEKLTARVKEENAFVKAVTSEISKTIVGQEKIVERIIISFLCDGHILIEGLPGLAKTLSVRAFAKCASLAFTRIQFTPDLLPADLTGTQVYNPKDMDFFVRKGPVFTNILLADEINRAPAKVQSALLQSMEERMVTIGDTTFPLPSPFMVLATENPIEQEGTYPLPEAQLDRFFMKCLISYPSSAEEKDILVRGKSISVDNLSPVINRESLAKVKELAGMIYADDKLIDYIIRIISETRSSGNKDLAKLVEFGASPRGSINLLKAARCMAFIRGRGFVTPDDVKEVAPDILRHRIILSYEAEAANISNDDVIKRILDIVEVP
jgi:MoxR-like ATPase